MADPTMTQALLRAKATGLTAIAGSFGGLSPELQAEAAHRLGSIAGLLSGLIVFTSILRNILFQYDPTGFQEDALFVGNVFSAAFAALSFGLYLLARRWKRFRAILWIGLAYEVATCLSVALLDAWISDLSRGGLRLSLITIFLMIFPAAVPARPAVRLATTTTCYLTLPFSLWVSHSLGKPVDHITFLLLPTFIAAVGALAVSRIVHGLSIQLTEARTLGAYQLVEKLGEGGMGEVWLGKHRMLARPAAIKLVAGDKLGADAEIAIRRFEREAQATSVLRSPHTVELYDFGVSDEGVCYYVMEFLEGRDLETVVGNHGPLPPGRVVHIMRQICMSLADAHRHKLVHRDIKPANIFLCRLGTEVDFVKVLDFGLVKAESDIAISDVKLSKENLIPGTPAYMAPELALTPEVGHSIDIYSLGCVGYFLLTGEIVFEGRTAMDVALKHVNETPVPPSERTEVYVPPRLEALILSCLEKNPVDRPESATELERLLAQLTDELTWSSEEASRWWEDNLPQLMEAPTPGVSSSLSPMATP